MPAIANTGSKSRESWHARAWRLFWLSVLVATALLSAAWWVLAPAGFGVAHPRFWANSVAPIIGLGAALGGLAALRRGSRPALRWVLPAWPAAWLGATVAGRLLFPITLGQIWLIPLVAAVVMSLAVLPLWRGANKRILAGGLSLALCVASCAGALVWTQYPPESRTRPSEENLVEPAPSPLTRPAFDTGVVRIGRDATIHSSEGSLIVRLSPLSISVNPLLTFLNGSQDA
jgi:hypothetical protein